MSRLWITLVVLSVAGCGEGPDVLAARARNASSTGRPGDVEAALSRLATIRLLSVTERLLRAKAASDSGRVSDAVKALEEAPGDGKGAADLALSRGRLEMARHRLRDAEAAFRRAIEVDPTRPEARLDRINLLAFQGRRAEMEAEFRALGGTVPLHFEDLTLWVFGHREEVGPAEVAEILGRAVRADPGDRASRLALAEALRTIGRLDEAEAALTPLDNVAPEVRAVRARIAIDAGDDDRAVSFLGREDGTAPALDRLRGRRALEAGDTREAERHFRSALRDEPDDRDALFGLGQALRVSGDPTAARPFLDAVGARDRLGWLVQNAAPPGRRGDPRVLVEIAQACRTLRRPALALAWYRLALVPDPLDSAIQRSIYELEREATREAQVE